MEEGIHIGLKESYIPTHLLGLIGRQRSHCPVFTYLILIIFSLLTSSTLTILNQWANSRYRKTVQNFRRLHMNLRTPE